MSKLLWTFSVATTLLLCNSAMADPVPYPDIGGGNASGGKTVKVGEIKSGSTSSSETGTTKGVVSSNSQGKTTTSPGSMNVKVEGKPVSITGNPGMGN